MLEKKIIFPYIGRTVLVSMLAFQMLFIATMWNMFPLRKYDFAAGNCDDKVEVEYRENIGNVAVPIKLTHEDKLIKTCRYKQNREISCRKLFEGDPVEITKAKSIPYKKPLTKCSLDNLLKNCSTFLSAHEYITEVSKMSPEELMFPLAFAIKMHKSSEQAEQLFRNIYRPHNAYCLYVDQKADIRLFMRMKNISKCLENVAIIEDRVNIVYASSAHIIAERQCMETLLSMKVRWKYYINLTGQEFPLRTNLEIVKILKLLNGANDIESYSFPKELSNRFEVKWYIRGNKMKHHNETKKPFQFDLNLRKGSAYGAFRREFVEFVNEDAMAQEFISWLNNTLAPEETVWSSLNAFLWAPGGYALETKHASSTFLSRAIIWAWDKENCKGNLLRAVCVLGIGDLPWLRSKPQLFVNKFDRKFDPLAIDCLEELIRNRTFSQSSVEDNLNWFYYRNLPHALYYGNLTNEEKSLKYLDDLKLQWTKDQINTDSPVTVTNYANLKSL